MHSSPSYLGYSGIGEYEPHYFAPTVPVPLQPWVTNTPLMRGDGVPLVHVPEAEQSPIFHFPQGDKKMSKSRNFGAPCLPCQAIARNPYSLGYSGALFDNLKASLKEGVQKLTADMVKGLSDSDKEALKSNIMGKASLYACENFGFACPDVTEEDGELVASAPIGLYVAVGVLGLGLLGTVLYIATKK